MASGLFADRGPDVELVDPAPGPANVRRVARREADFCLTSVLHYLVARQQDEQLAARFVAVVVQRSPMAAIVPEDSPVRAPADLPGRRLAGPPQGRLTVELLAAMRSRGLDPPVLVACEYSEAPAALGRGQADAVADFIDLVPRVRRQAGVPVRGVPVGAPVYASGLVASDTVPDTLVDRAAALEGWSLTEPNTFVGVPPGSMDPVRWAATLRHYAAGHGLPHPDPTTVYRPRFARMHAGIG